VVRHPGRVLSRKHITTCQAWIREFIAFASLGEVIDAGTELSILALKDHVPA